MKIDNRIAEILSAILSPVSIAFVSVLIFTFYPVDYSMPSDTYLNLIFGIIFLCIFPVIAILYSYKKGKVDIWVSERSIRTPFYIIAIMGYVIATIIFYFLKNLNLFFLSISYCMVTIVITFGNLFRKISAHGAGVAGPITAITFNFGIYAIPLFLLLPITIWARIKLKAHSLFEVITGILIAIVITFCVYNMLYPYPHFLM